MSDGGAVAPQEARRYRLVLTLTAALTMLIFSIGHALQATALLVYDAEIVTHARLLANLGVIPVMLVATWCFPIQRMTWPRKIATLVAASLVTSALRFWLQGLLGVPRSSATGIVWFNLVPVEVVLLFSVGIALALAEYQALVVERGREAARQALVAATAMEALRTEELGVRRRVADALHGTVQQQLVLLAADLRSTARKLSASNPQASEHADLSRISDRLDEIRERDVRDLSHLLYPTGIDFGLAQACRVLLSRIPPCVEVIADIDESVLTADDPATGGIPLEFRLLAIRVVEEGVTNAVRHGEATELRISLRVDDDRELEILVEDNGRGPAKGAAMSGLRLLTESVSLRGGSLGLSGLPSGGARLVGRLPLPDPEE